MTSVTTLNLEPGAVLTGRYEICEKIGSGGMGMVFKAIDRELNNEVVALKLLLPHLAADDTVFRRFLNEVLVARSLSHPNIVRIHDIGKVEGGFHYISMEYVDGVSLKDRLNPVDSKGNPNPDYKPFTFDEVVSILFSVANGVSYAHEKGIIHRDLKPANVLLSKKGDVKLADFGTARIVGMDTSLTQTGQVIGTPDYMSPEQIRGESLDASCDIYSLGIMAYELVAAERPFVADSAVAVAFKHLSEPLPDLTTRQQLKSGLKVPQWYQQLLNKACAKEKGQRFSSVVEFARFLQQNSPALQTGFFSGDLSSVLKTAQTEAVKGQGDFKLGEVKPANNSGSWKFDSPAAEWIPPKKKSSPLPLLLVVLLVLLAAGVYLARDPLEKQLTKLTRSEEKPLPVATPVPVAKNELGKLEQELLSSFDAARATQLQPPPLPNLAPGVTLTPVATPSVEPSLQPTDLPTAVPTAVATPTITDTPKPVENVAVELEIRLPGSSKSIYLIPQGELTRGLWSLSVSGLNEPSMDILRDQFAINVVSVEGKRMIAKLSARDIRLPTSVGRQSVLAGGLEALEGISAGDYRFDVLRSGEVLLSKTVTVEAPKREVAKLPVEPQPTREAIAVRPAPTPESVAVIQPGSSLPLAQGIEVAPTPEPTLVAAIQESFAGVLSYRVSDGGDLQPKKLTMELITKGKELSGTASIEGLGEFSIVGSVGARGVEINLLGAAESFRLSGVIRDGKIRGIYGIAGKQIRGSWEASRR